MLNITPETSRIAEEDVAHRWSDTDLKPLLDYVYFEMELMESPRRGDSL